MPTKFAMRLLAGTALSALLGSGVFAAEARPYDIPQGDAALSLQAFAMQSGKQVLFPFEAARGKKAPAIQGDYSDEAVVALLAESAGLHVTADDGKTVTLRAAADPQGGSAAGGGAEVEALIVTAQKREENIQDVPIAISAFSAKALEEQKIEGGFDLLKAIPNVTFSKNNFTSYNFSIRGIGTKAVSATTDPGVAVSFNNAALLQNRLFEQEYFDVERVEVLRGPQGTLYGRNATAGVINVISAKPDMDDFDGSVKGEVGNYHSKRISAMVNVPLVEDKLAIRLAGALTDRQGYDYNSLTHNAVNGRDLWSARMTVQFNPTERIRSNLIWERFNEDDNRSRTGKQLCHRDAGLTEVNGFSVIPQNTSSDGALLHQALFSQGCQPGSLYESAAFGTPNGLALPFVFALAALGNGTGSGCCYNPVGVDRETHTEVGIILTRDPYASAVQSRDLRVIESIKDPRYRAKADVVELNFEMDLSDSLTFFSQSVYDKDSVYSFQDFNRFNTQPIFTDTSNLGYRTNGYEDLPSSYQNLARGGVFCDPQLGCTDRMVGFDISQAKSEQIGQEIRLQSSFDGPLNFSVGANYTRFKVLVDYYVFYNLITAFAQIAPFNGSDIPGDDPDPSMCRSGIDFLGGSEIIPTTDPRSKCPYIDPNPIESIDGQGHNYFRSKNPYKLRSAAAFGELYWQATDALKVTAGLRYTDDRKTFIPVPSQVLLAPGIIAGGDVPYGYPEKPAIKQHWGEWTGRLGVDWKPSLSFTEQTMIYAFYSRGYKGGGANPPTPGFATLADYERQYEMYQTPQWVKDFMDSIDALPELELTGVEYSRTFEPEFVNAFEVGAKNTLLDGALQFNTGAFFYDYKDYQVSQIRDRTAVNENFDAKVWGLEFETRFSPSRNFQLIGNLGYLDTEIGEGMQSIDIMDRTAGNTGFVVTKPWAQLPSNCIVPVDVVQSWMTLETPMNSYMRLCGGARGPIFFLQPPVIDPATGQIYDPRLYNGENGTVNIHGGSGIAKDLAGNELPNSPHWTANVGTQYGMDLLEDWRVTVRGDAYWQSQSWARVYNDNPYDKLHGWYNLNLSIWFEKPDQDLKIELYAKNLLDKTPITDSFLNSDDTALTTNVFVLDPRLIGLSIRKGF